MSATPKFVDGSVVHPCTSEVIFTEMYCPAADTGNAATGAPVPGVLVAVIAYSLHGPLTGASVTEPAVFTRFSKQRDGRARDLICGDALRQAAEIKPQIGRIAIAYVQIGQGAKVDVWSVCTHMRVRYEWRLSSVG